MRFDKRSFSILYQVLLLSAVVCGLLNGCASGRVGVRADGAVIYAAIGDSTGTGLGARGGGYVERLFARIKGQRPASRLINLSHTGADTERALRQQASNLGAAGPTLVTVNIGMNDLLGGVPEDEFASRYEELVSRLLETDAVIILTTLPDLSMAPAFTTRDAGNLSARLMGYNQRIEAIARRHSLPLVDLYRESRESLGQHPEFFSQDGLHPSDAGYAYWAELLWPAVSKAIG